MKLTMDSLSILISEAKAEGVKAAYCGQTLKQNPYTIQIQSMLNMTLSQAWKEGFKQGKDLAKGKL
jgi:hypothetical protein